MIKSTKKSRIKTDWHLIDARGQILGRLASTITPLLIGKRKPYYVSNLDCGDQVVIINAAEIRVTGRKEKQKSYYSYSGYPGGLRVQSYLEVKSKYPERIISSAVENMLPKNKLRSLWLGKLHVFPGNIHPYEEKFKTPEQKVETKKSQEKKIKRAGDEKKQ